MPAVCVDFACVDSRGCVIVALVLASANQKNEKGDPWNVVGAFSISSSRTPHELPLRAKPKNTLPSTHTSFDPAIRLRHSLPIRWLSPVKPIKNS